MILPSPGGTRLIHTGKDDVFHVSTLWVEYHHTAGTVHGNPQISSSAEGGYETLELFLSG